jgi:hypothetical protein
MEMGSAATTAGAVIMEEDEEARDGGTDVVGLRDLLEEGVGLRRGVLVGVVLHGEAAVGLLELVVGGAAADAEHLVVVHPHRRRRRTGDFGPLARGSLRIVGVGSGAGLAAIGDRRWLLLLKQRKEDDLRLYIAK